MDPQWTSRRQVVVGGDGFAGHFACSRPGREVRGSSRRTTT
jgi:hypothetical protein